MADHDTSSLDLKIPQRTAAFAKFIGFEVDIMEPGRCRLGLVVRDELRQPAGLLHGGITATLIDTAVAYALYAAVPTGTIFVTTEMSVYYLAPIKDGRVTAEATIVFQGRRTALAEATVRTADGTLAAKSMSRFALNG